jgi:ubiquinone/menaquinone biosynthesis C-methylase UbiE
MEESTIQAPPPQRAVRESQEDLQYWDIASRYWKDVVTVNPTWAWDAFYSQHIPHAVLNILVLGVTNGAFLELIKKFRPQAQVYAIDFSFQMITHVKKIEQKIVCGRGDRLPFADESFDLILSDYFLSVLHKDILESVLKEIDRCLGKEGMFLAKELRHTGHMAAWILSLVLVGVSSLICAGYNSVSAIPLVGLFVLIVPLYNPLDKKMGKTSALLKFFIHFMKFIMKRKHIPNRREIHELYFLSKKYLNIFSDESLQALFKETSLHNVCKSSVLSWNFSIIGQKNNGNLFD